MDYPFIPIKNWKEITLYYILISLFSLAAALVISLLLVSCGGNGKDGESNEPIPQKTANIVLHGNIYETKDSSDDIKLLGELKNIGEIDATFIKITFTFKDILGTIIGTDYAYVHGTNKTLTKINFEDSSILTPNDIGAFQLYTDIPFKGIHEYDYNITWNHDDTAWPDAKIVLYGKIKQSTNYLGWLELSGNLKNIGNKTGKHIYIDFILKNSSGYVIDIAIFNFIEGSTIYLPSIDDFTSTALLPNEIGTFKTWSIIRYPSEISSYYYKIAWFDHESASTRVKSIFIESENDLNIEELWKKRRNAIDKLWESIY